MRAKFEQENPSNLREFSFTRAERGTSGMQGLETMPLTGDNSDSNLNLCRVELSSYLASACVRGVSGGGQEVPIPHIHDTYSHTLSLINLIFSIGK